MYFDLEQRTMGGVITYAAKTWPTRTAIHWEEGGLTFKELDELSEKFAKGLIANGIKKGDRMGLWMHNHPEWAVAWFGIAKVGAVLVPLDYWYKTGEIEYILHHSGAKGIVISEANLGVDFPAMTKEVCKNVPYLELVVVMKETDEDEFCTWNGLLNSSSEVSEIKYKEATKDIHEDDIDFIRPM